MSLLIQLRGVDVAVIPAYQPTGILLDLVREVTAAGCEVIVVNDSSSRASRPIFEQLKEMPDVTVLRHAVNAGKGAALKTAFRYIRDWKSPDTFIATMDADGQHLPADLQRVLLAARLHPGALVLGARTFGRGCPCAPGWATKPPASCSAPPAAPPGSPTPRPACAPSATRCWTACWPSMATATSTR